MGAEGVDGVEEVVVSAEVVAGTVVVVVDNVEDSAGIGVSAGTAVVTLLGLMGALDSLFSASTFTGLVVLSSSAAEEGARGGRVVGGAESVSVEGVRVTGGDLGFAGTDSWGGAMACGRLEPLGTPAGRLGPGPDFFGAPGDVTGTFAAAAMPSSYLRFNAPTDNIKVKDKTK